MTDLDCVGVCILLTTSAKGLAKYATLIYTINDLTKDTGLARSGLDRLKAAFAVFAENRQKFPLVYERELPVVTLEEAS